MFMLGACMQTPKPQASARGSSATSRPTLDQLKSRADELLSLMASENYNTREEATRALRGLLKDCPDNRDELIAYIDNQYEESEDPEIHQRVEKTLEEYLKPWNCFTKQSTLKFYYPVISVNATTDNRLLVSARPKSDSELPEKVKELGIWDAEINKCSHILKGHESYVISATTSPDGKLIATGSADRTVRLWSLSNGECLRVLKGHKLPVSIVVFTPDGKLLASAGLDSSEENGADIRIWDVHSGKYLRTVENATNHALAMAFSPDGEILAGAGGWDGHTIRFWNPQTGECTMTLEGHQSYIQSLAFSPDGELLASTSGPFEDTVRIWDVESGECLQVLRGHEETVWTAAFSRDGRMLAAGDRDGIIRIWDPHTGKRLRVLSSGMRDVCSLAFAADSRRLISSYFDNEVIIWGIPEDEEEEESK
jgi:WD40 repeat protein